MANSRAGHMRHETHTNTPTVASNNPVLTSTSTVHTGPGDSCPAHDKAARPAPLAASTAHAPSTFHRAPAAGTVIRSSKPRSSEPKNREARGCSTPKL